MSSTVPPMIVRVFGDGQKTVIPVTPYTTTLDVIECCRDPGDEICDLIAVCPDKGECALKDDDHPLEILRRWGSGRLVLRYTVLRADGSTYEKRNGMKEPDHFGDTLPDGVQLTLNELREMACRQQAQIDSQHQLLAAKEQRLRYLKEQEARQQRVQAESERLRRLRDRVDAQEMKLRKLRAIRGQVDHQKQNNISLTSDLDSIRALFNEKEKELSLAVAKVEELTRQLEELRRGRSARDQTPASALELDKLRRELMYRNKLNEQQNQRLNQQREALTARQEEMSAIDKRISELQERLHRKRLLNQQLANQISAASHKAAYHQLVRLTGSADQTNAGYLRKPQTNTAQPANGLSRSNIAAVEPYNHVPLPTGHQRNNSNNNVNGMSGVNSTVQENNTYHPYSTQNHHHIKSESDQVLLHDNTQETNNKISNFNANNNSNNNSRQDDADLLKEFTVSKSDPKYQTLPYNTKFTVNLIPTRMSNNCKSAVTSDNIDNNVDVGNNENKDGLDLMNPSTTTATSNTTVMVHAANGSNNSNVLQQQQSTHMTVHSAPLNMLNKNIATPLNQNDLINRKLLENFNSHNTCVENSNAYHHHQQHHNQNGVKTANDTSPINNVVSAMSYQKPISSVAPTSVHHSGKLSNIYQTSSIKVQPVEPQTIVSQKQLSPTISGNASNNNSSNSHSFVLSPPQSNSTPYNTPETSIDKTPKPALPPKPAIKPPPRQTQIYDPNSGGSSSQQAPPPVPLSEPPDDTIHQQHHHHHLQQQQQPSQHKTNNQKSQMPPLSTNPQKSFLSNQQQQNLPAPHNYPAQTGQSNQTSSQQSNETMPIIKAKPLTIKKQPFSEQPKLRNVGSSYSKLNGNNNNGSSNNSNSSSSSNNNNSSRKIEMPAAFHFAELNADKIEPNQQQNNVIEEIGAQTVDETDKSGSNNNNHPQQHHHHHHHEETLKKDAAKSDAKVLPSSTESVVVVRRCKKGNLKQTGKITLARRVSFDPLALLLDASLEGELELVKKTATQVPNPSAANDEGITALHNAICAGHLEIVKFLVEFGCDVNAQDSDGWTPLHCAASCNNVAMVRFLVEHGACIFATTLSDHETAAEKCEEDEEGFDGCSEYLYSVQEKLGILSGGVVYAVFDYTAQQSDELSFKAGQQLTVLRKGDESEREWWWSRLGDKEGYVPRNLLGLYPRVSRNEE